VLAACFATGAAALLARRAVDPSGHRPQLHCFTLLREESARGAACLAVTHDLISHWTYATRLIVLADGKVAFDAGVDDAIRSTEWLSLFSSRLTLSKTGAGRPWVSYS